MGVMPASGADGMIDAPSLQQQKLLRKIVVASVIGNALEWYDFFLYGTAAALIFGPLFFPIHGDPLMGTLAAFAGFAIGFVARPFGGVIFGHVGDRYGRKKALVITLTLMGCATFLIGVLPTFQQAGYLAPVALVALRVLQGVASGGEWGGGVLMISENAPPKKRGYYASWSQLGIAGGFVLSSAVFFMTQSLTKDDFLVWGWRIPFLASILIFGIGVYIRRKLPESKEFEKSEKTHHLPIYEVIKRHPKSVLQAMGIRFAENGSSSIFLSFSLVYGKSIGVPTTVILAGVMIAMSLELVTIPLWGKMCDRVGRKPIYLFGSIGLILVAFPFFWMMDTQEKTLIYLALVLGMPICHGAMIGAQPSLMGDMFPTSVRYSGMALGHEMASVFSGGVAPLVATALFAEFHAAWTGALILVVFGLITSGTLLSMREPNRSS